MKSRCWRSSSWYVDISVLSHDYCRFPCLLSLYLHLHWHRGRSRSCSVVRISPFLWRCGCSYGHFSHGCLERTKPCFFGFWGGRPLCIWLYTHPFAWKNGLHAKALLGVIHHVVKVVWIYLVAFESNITQVSTSALFLYC